MDNNENKRNVDRTGGSGGYHGVNPEDKYDFERFAPRSSGGASGQGRTAGSGNSSASANRSGAQRRGESGSASSGARPSGRSSSQNRPAAARGGSSGSSARRTQRAVPDRTSSAQNSRPVHRNVDRTGEGTAVTGTRTRRDNKKKKRTVGSTIGRIALSVFLIGTIAVCLVIGVFGIYVFGFVDDTIDFDLNDLKVNYTSVIYTKDADGNWVEYQKLYEENRTWVPIRDISQNVIDAYVCAEDQRFYNHSGVDWKRTFGSFVNMFIDIYGTDSGGSTITQQLVKNLTGDNDKSPMRKIREIMRARKIEDTYAKETIMECYLNVIYLNNNAYGVEAAAKYYFDKHASELNIHEAASLAAITKSPSAYDPITNPENHLERRNWVIYKMYEQGKISEEEYETEKQAEIDLGGRAALLASGDTEGAAAATQINSYFTDTVIEEVIADLMEQKGYTYTYAQNMIYRGGLKIYSTLDTNVQSAIDEVFSNDEYWSKVYGTEQTPQGSITVMDYSGHIVGISGGRGEKTINRGLNRAYQSKRQPGSTMKPLGVYAPGIELNYITYSTKVSNAKYTVGGFSFKNYDSSTSGPVTVQNALERSLNLVPARIMNEMITAERSYDFVTERFGITTLVRSEQAEDGRELSDVNISAMALGGSTYGLTNVEMTAAYATFGNGGKYWSPTTYTSISDQHDKPVLEQQAEPTTALTEETAMIMNQLLQTVVTGSSGTARSAAFGDWEIMAKTGTTSDNKDRWFVGGTPYYIASVWFGCDTPADMSRMSSSANPAQRLWKPIFEKIHEGKEKISFPTCDTVVKARYCTASGGLAKAGCRSTAVGYYKSDYAPYCTVHSGSSSGQSSGSTSSKKPSGTSSNPPAASSQAASSQPAEASSQAAESTAAEPEPAESAAGGE